jgi:hypothetical protein
MTDRLLDLTALALLLGTTWLLVSRLSFVLGPESCWTVC